MNQYTISLDGESVGVMSKTDLSTIFAKWTNIPYLTGIEISSGGEHEFIIEYINSDGNSVRYAKKRACVAMPLTKLQTGELLLYAALPFLEVLCQRKSIVTIHAAAVELFGKAILLLGKAGAGKTSLALSLCRNHQAKLIGNDIVKVGLLGGKAIARAGSKYFFLRKESIKRNIPDLLSLFPQSEKDPWTHKIYCLPDKLGVATRDECLPITQSYLVHVDETMECLYSTNADRMDTRLYLNENMSRYIRGTAVALFSEQSHFLGYVPSYDTSNLFAMRVKLMEALIADTGMMYIAGNLHDTSRYIVTGKKP